MQSVAKVLRETMPGMFSDIQKAHVAREEWLKKRKEGVNGEWGTQRPDDVGHG